MMEIYHGYLIEAGYCPPRHDVPSAGGESWVVGLIEEVGRADEVVGELGPVLLRLNLKHRRRDEHVADQGRPPLGNRSLDVLGPAGKAITVKAA